MPLRASTSDKVLLWYLQQRLKRTKIWPTIHQISDEIAALQLESQFEIYANTPEDDHEFFADLEELKTHGNIEVSGQTVLLTPFGELVSALFEPLSALTAAYSKLYPTEPTG